MIPADDALWPQATGPNRARWAAQALELYLHLVRLIMTRAVTWPASEVPFPPEALGLAQQLHEAIAHRVDALGRPPSPDVLCPYCGARLYVPYPPVPDEEAWPAFCDTCGIVGLVTAGGRWTDEARLFDLSAERRA